MDKNQEFITLPYQIKELLLSNYKKDITQNLNYKLSPYEAFVYITK